MKEDKTMGWASWNFQLPTGLPLSGFSLNSFLSLSLFSFGAFIISLLD